MCGISGLITQDPSIDKRKVIAEMNALIDHRGPDDGGMFFDSELAFGHRRLSILDLSEGGHQPMSYRTCTITYNGEIYNYIELKKELVKLGYKFSTETDTEVILAAYVEWGEECVSRFNGMWSFAIYDPGKNVVFCSRDRFGVKPFYYLEKNNSFVFGSEIKQLLISMNAKKANKKILMDYLVTGFIEHTDETFFEGVEKLPQGHNLIYNLESNSFNIKKYYDLHEGSKSGNDDFSKEKHYKDELLRSIKLRFRSDVKVGACLSGGLDSSTLCALSTSLYEQEGQLTAIHAKSTEVNTDESHFASQVADHCNLNMQIVEPTFQDFLSSIDDVVQSQEEPFGGASIFMQYFVMRKARESGCIVMLDGQAGDETLLGYERYYPAVFFELFRSLGLRKVLRAVRNALKHNQNLSFKKLMVYSIGSFFAELRKKVYLRHCFFLKKNSFSQFEHLDLIAKSYWSVHALQKLELQKTNLPELLRYEDKNSMAHSVEARLPYVDFQTVEAALGLPVESKINKGWTKNILRVIANDKLPSEVVWRKNKFGFNAPETSWLDQASGLIENEIMDSELLDSFIDKKQLLRRYKSVDAKLKWRLFNLAVWGRVFDVKAS